MAKKTPRWYEILEAARRAAGGGTRPFTASDLADAAAFTGTKRSTPEQIASGYLSKLCRWGYVRREGAEASGKRWVRTYTLTTFGKDKAPPEFSFRDGWRAVLGNALKDARLCRECRAILGKLLEGTA